jgi:hypothetical protein
MKMFLTTIGCIIALIILFFVLPYSPTKSAFNKEIEELKKEKVTEDILTIEDIEGLPKPVQGFYVKQGYIGKPKSNYVRIQCKNVTFVMDKKNLKMDSDQYNFVSEPSRIAFMKSSLFGIPFEGRDRFVNGEGSMKGVLAKLFTLFNQTGKNMDTACLATYLSEILFIPAAALNDSVVWEPISDTQAKAKITHKGITASGIFNFNKKGEFISYDTDDREMIGADGKGKKEKWTAYCSGYKMKNGLRTPTHVHATWHLEDGDLVYFKSDEVQLSYDFQ